MTANASPSPTFAARFSDGRTAATNQAEVRFSATGLVIRAPGHDEAITWPYARLRTAQPLFSRSTDRLSRQNQLGELVRQSPERPNISAFARQFGVARRTIIRDLQELIRRGQLPPEAYPEWEDPAETE